MTMAGFFIKTILMPLTPIRKRRIQMLINVQQISVVYVAHRTHLTITYNKHGQTF